MSRSLTQLYEEALRALGLRATQFTILQVLSRSGEVSQSRLGEMLAMDSTTLTRTLDVMRRQGWLEARQGEDRRWRFWRLADEGEALLRRAEPAWEEVQARVRRRLGKENWDKLLRLSNEITGVLESDGDQL